MGDPRQSALAERYRLDRPIGRGGMGDVWAGHDLRLDRPVAVKRLRPDLARDDEARLRFEVEATAAAQLAHPNVVVVYDTGEDAGLPYIVMELLSGHTLRDELERGPLDAARTRVIADQVLAALGVAHRAGIVHRDIKPGNVLRAGPDVWKLADFGIAKSLEGTSDLTMAGLVPGTPAYVAPERLVGEAATPATDLYSVGVMLYEGLAGRRPFIGDNPAATLHAIRTATAPPLGTLRPDVDATLTRAVERAMQRDPRRRFADADAMRAALTPSGSDASTRPDAAATEPIRPPRRARGDGSRSRTLVRRPPPPRRGRPRWSWVALAGAALFVAVVGVVLSSGHSGSQSPTPPSTAATAVTAPATPAAANLPGPLQGALNRLDRTVRP